MPDERPSYADELDTVHRELFFYFSDHEASFPKNTVIGLSPVALMPNNAGHRDRVEAIRLLQENIQSAREMELPNDLIRHAAQEALRCRGIIFGNDIEEKIIIDELYR